MAGVTQGVGLLDKSMLAVQGAGFAQHCCGLQITVLVTGLSGKCQGLT